MTGLNRSVIERLGTVARDGRAALSAEVRAQFPEATFPDVESYTWVPPTRIRARLPADYEFGLVAARGRDGLRLFAPLRPWRDHIWQAFLGGMEVLTQIEGWTDAERCLVRPQWLHYARLLNSTSPLSNKFGCDRAFRVGRGAPSPLAGQPLLPVDLLAELDREPGCDRPLGRLRELGRRAAAERNTPAPTPEQLYWLGCYAAARRMDPPTPRPDAATIRARVRDALYAGIPDLDDPRVREHMREVYFRYLTCLGKHVHSAHPDADGRLERMAMGVNNLPRQLGRLTTRTSGPLDKADVRAALNGLGWAAGAQVADLLDALLGVLEELIDPPLAEAELGAFRLLHRKTEVFGGIPYPLVERRSAVLAPALLDLMAAADDEEERRIVGALDRLVLWYGMMASQRREIDRETKRRPKYTGGGPVDYTGEGASVAAKRPAGRENRPPGAGGHEGGRDEQLEAMYSALRTRCGVTCDCRPPDRPDWESVIDDAAASTVTILHSCRRCGTRRSTDHSWDDLSSYG
jgi:hypothetical protein